MRALQLRAFAGLLFLFVVLAVLLFLPASPDHFWQAWVFLAVFWIPSLAITLYLMKKDPELLARRMSSGPTAEKEPAQKIIMLLVSVGFIALIVVPALDHRFGWSHMSAGLVLAGDLLILLGWLAIFFVFRANTYAAATIQLAPGQTIISTGPYALVRHPMYAGGLLMLVGMPIALGSWWGLLVILAMMPVLIWRLFEEEKFLVRNLAGYVAYQRNVPYRMIPLVW
jgi:protein-S-isoprenylcysteine O-methyltransferase Ste14